MSRPTSSTPPRRSLTVWDKFDRDKRRSVDALLLVSLAVAMLGIIWWSLPAVVTALLSLLVIWIAS